ncbi:transglutaminase domain-containing protein [Actinoplanes sp. SE50]|uniref:DUF3488 and transglutaminase-like domain-containing protein n=1 Tax=unclassified Actinoplanes TaxID=2626549 RepID=UPI00023EC42A|nr:MULTISPECIES: transglutaminase domain-containing protein [unclassified Actinoplanes]AEV83586.1 transglutaminase domain-containing protein [Actinoplanes sp. SE50/110]ATO82270.1 transglutaminase domain-containing protein [Actinoplanes sp. SE50]SLL99677.1 hypothetical protein ACSP50_2908 [Actinoplanes sp. SE50/110]
MTTRERIGALVDRLAAGAAATAAGLTFAPAFAGGHVPSAVTAAAVLTGLLTPYGRPRRAALRAPVAILLALGCGMLAAVAAGAAPRRTRALGDVLAGGLSETLRVTLPLPERYAVVPTVLAAAAAAAGATLARRRTGGLEALIPALAVAGCGIVAAGISTRQTVPLAIGIVAVLVLLLRPAAARTLPAAAVVLLIAAAALVRLPATPDAGTADPRRYFVAPQRANRSADLLDQVAGWLSTPTLPLFTATGDPVSRWRLAVLDTYDGVSWSSGAAFVPAGLGVPPYPAGGPEPGVRQHVVLGALTGPYLPAADRPARVTEPVTAVDPVDGVLLTDRRPATGAAYDIGSVPHTAPAEPIVAPAAAGDAAETAVPAEIRTALRTFLRSVPLQPGMTAAARARTVEWYLSTHRRNVTGAAATAGTGSVVRLLGPRGIGTTVQFATAFALLMRELGIPSRLVVGFQPHTPGAVYGADALVWAQLRYAGPGWVDYQPTPPAVRPGDTVPPPAGAPPDEVTRDVPTQTPPPVAEPAPAPARRTVTLLLAAAVTVGGYLAVTLVLPVLRRAWRRRGGPPADRIARAWHDVLDEAAHGALAPARIRTMTPFDVSAALAAAGGRDNRALATLAALADKALYGTQPCTAAEAAQAWRCARPARFRLRRWRTLVYPSRLRTRAR